MATLFPWDADNILKRGEYYQSVCSLPEALADYDRALSLHQPLAVARKVALLLDLGRIRDAHDLNEKLIHTSNEYLDCATQILER